MKFTLALTLFLPLIAMAQRPSGQSFSLEELTGVLSKPVGPQVDCFDPKETPPCADITTTYCSNIATNNGKVSDSSGTVNLGKSERSQISELERANLVDTTRALTALPPDLKAALAKPIAKLSALIQTENDSKDWYKDVAKTRKQIADQISDFAEKRADASLKQKFSQGQRATSADKAAERDKQEKELMDTFTKAKMETSPNWGRLTTVLGKVKEDMIAVINTLPLSPEEKQDRLNKINQTNLSTPFGVRVGGPIGKLIEQDCRTNMVNAMYMSLNGTLTVCAGILNGFQSENSLYFTLAHELAHSFNHNNLQHEHSQPRYSSLTQKMVETNGNIPCDEYARLTEQSKAQDNYECGRDAYNTFMSCLKGNHPVVPKNGNQIFAELKPFYEKANFCAVTQPDQGLAYMNPNEFADRNFAKYISSTMQEYTGPAIESARGLLSPAYYVVQEKRCNPSRPCPEVVESARIRAAMGTNPPECLNVSKVGVENESDWYAHKAMTIRLRSVTDIRQRRELIASSMGLFCGYSYSRAPSDKQIKKLQKELEKLAQEGGGEAASHHSNDKERIGAVMTEEMSSLLQCTRNPETPETKPSYQSCRL